VLRGNQVPAEIVIVDQSDEPHTLLPKMKPEWACEIRYIHSRTTGAGAARNIGIASSHYEIVILTDDDMSVAPDWLNHLVRALVKAGPRSVVSGQVLPAESEVPGGIAPSTKVDQDPAVYQGRIGKDVLFTGNMAAYRAVFDEIGGFDERLGPGTAFPAAEDNDFGFRLLENGYRILYAPEAILYHRAWRSKRDHLSLGWSYGVGRGAYYAKHMSVKDRYMLSRMFRDIKVNLMDFLGHFRRERRLDLGYPLLIFGVLYGAIRWRIIQTRRSLM
jgi:GT2 family glycosyltransferase